jgi:phage recombination protein Bet
MTSTDVATTGGSALAIRPGQTQWTDEQLAVLRHMSTERATKADLDVFLHRCQQLELDPFAGQIHLVEYGGKPTIQVGIHGLESTSRTTADRAGVDIEWEDPQWCGPDGQWVDVWLSEEPPVAARAVLLRDGKRYPQVCLYREFVGMKKVYRDKKWTGEWEVNSMWAGKPAHMLNKCARAGALRAAFPRQLSNVYAPEELGERPEMVRGEVVREEPAPTPGGLQVALEFVAAATTRDELLAVWNNYAPGLSVADRAHLQAAGQQAIELLEQGQRAASAPEPSNPATDAGPDLGPLLDALNTLGYRDEVDQLAFVGTVLSQTVDSLAGIGPELGWLVGKLQEAATASDPQAYLDDLLSGVTP